MDALLRRRWVNIPKPEQVSGYWKAIPNDETTWLDGGDFEIVYVYYDGKWSVMRCGESTRERLEDFWWLGQVITL